MAHAEDYEVADLLATQVGVERRIGEGVARGLREVHVTHAVHTRVELGPRRAAHRGVTPVVQSVNALAHEAMIAPRDELGGEALVDEATALIVGYLRVPRRGQ